MESSKIEYNRRRVKKIIKILSREFPDVRVPLRYSTPFELLIATILAAQCTDVKVNEVTETLFKKYRSPKAYAEADLNEIEEDIRPTGFYRNKAKSIKKCCQRLVTTFKGKVPDSLDELLTLSGVGRKTANVVLGNAFGIPGVIVDRHVQRVSRRIGLTENEDPTKIEYDLMEVAPKKEWTHLSNLFTWHGRKTCLARNPLCPICPILRYCEYGSKRILERSPGVGSPK